MGEDTNHASKKHSTNVRQIQRVGNAYNCFLAVYLPGTMLTQCRKNRLPYLQTLWPRELLKVIRFSKADPSTS